MGRSLNWDVLGFHLVVIPDKHCGSVLNIYLWYGCLLEISWPEHLGLVGPLDIHK